MTVFPFACRKFNKFRFWTESSPAPSQFPAHCQTADSQAPGNSVLLADLWRDQKEGRKCFI